jgi:hypothetical protein
MPSTTVRSGEPARGAQEYPFMPRVIRDIIMHLRPLIIGLCILFVWLAFLLAGRPRQLQPGTVGLAVGFAGGSIWLLEKYTVTEDEPIVFALFVVFFVSVVLLVFAELYWLIGTDRDFTTGGSLTRLPHPLTRVDAVYFALGTLSTAGTGNISAVSDRARAIQSGQMLTDLVLVLGAITLAMWRYTTLLSKNGDAPEEGDASQEAKGV